MPKLRFSVGRSRGPSRHSATHTRFTRGVQAQMAEVIKNAQKVIDAIEAESIPAMKYALRPILDTSQELVPVKTGRLKRSGFIEVRHRGKVVEGVVGYARSEDPDYAVFVHERMDLHHTPPTQAKFLEEAVNRHFKEIPERYAHYVRNGLGL